MISIIQHSHFKNTLNFKLVLIFALTIFLLLGLVDTQGVSAQENVNEIETLNIEFWPDFDQESVLVFLAGTLPAESSQPATVTLPLPNDATLNVVARVSELGNLIDDVVFDESVPGELMLTLPNRNFHVEYYLPYVRDDDTRSFDFTWLSEVSVNQLKITFQQPFMATDTSINPEPARVFTGSYELQYHESSVETVAAGTPYNYEASYRMMQPELTAGLVSQEQATQTDDSGAIQIDETSKGFNWSIMIAVFGGLIVLGSAIWLLYSRSASNRRVIKPRPIRRVRTASDSDRASKSQRVSQKIRYCHECGQRLDSSDKFCRRCGTPVKGH